MKRPVNNSPGDLDPDAFSANLQKPGDGSCSLRPFRIQLVTRCCCNEEEEPQRGMEKKNKTKL